MIPTSTMPHTPGFALRVMRQGSGVVRVVFALTLLLQLVSGVVVPVLHEGMARPLAAHLDKPGTPHHAHDEASCATCVASHGVGRIERPAAVLPLVLVAVLAATEYDDRVVATRVDPARSPRGPPAIA